MAIFHCQMKTVKRSDGRSATAAAAYRAGERIVDERTGEIHDYTRKGGVEFSQIVLPDAAPTWAGERAALWNGAESAERRKNSVVAREFELGLPAELSAEDRQRLALDFAAELVERHQVAADVAIHSPSRSGDERNHHAHVLFTTRRMTVEGLGEKTRELDDRRTGSGLVEHWRERWATLQNERLAERGHAARVDHRSLEAQGIEREPQGYLGPSASAMERRGVESDRGQMMREVRRERGTEIDRMSDRQLRAAIQAIDLQDPERMAAANKGVASRAAEAHTARTAWGIAQTTLQMAQTAEDNWRKQHRVRAWAQDRLGVGGGDLAKRREAAEKAAHRAGQIAASAEHAWQSLHGQVKANIERVQRAPRERERALQLELRARRRERSLERQIERELGRGRGYGLER